MRSNVKVLPAWQYIIIFSPPIAYIFLANILKVVKSQSVTGDIIVISTILLLSFITYYSIYQNKRFNIHLKGILETINRDPGSSPLAKEILAKYRAEKKNDDLQINIPSFLESYFADFQLENTNIVKNLKLIQTYASITILIGVLGTFVGLVYSLAGIEAGLKDNSIMNILSGVNTAFYTSIAGILYSIGINLHSRIVNSEQLLIQLMLKIENFIHQSDHESSDMKVIHAMVDVKEAIERMGQSFIDVADFSKNFERATKNMYQFNADFSKNTGELSRLFGDMREVSALFNERSKQIHDDFGKLFDYFHQQEAVQSTLVNSVQYSAEKVASIWATQAQQQKEMSFVLNNIVQDYHATKEQFSNVFNSAVDRVHDAYEEMAKFFDGSLGQQKLLVESQQRIEEKNSSYIKEVESATSVMKHILENSSFENLASVSESFSENTEKLQKFFQKLGFEIAQLKVQNDSQTSMFQNLATLMDEQLSSHRTTQEDFNAYLRDSFSQNEQIQQSFKEAISNFENYKQNNERLTELAAQMEDTFKNNYVQQQQQSESLKAALNEYVIKSSESMNKLFSLLEDSLDNSFKDTLKHFQRYIGTTNDIIERKFDAMDASRSTMEEVGYFTLNQLQDSIMSLDSNVQKLATGIQDKTPEPVGQ
ncbi:MotA/TolQ/ExbB proton channel family protein [Bacillus sp. ISL-41]|uniref:MotA/TolQ/ExbB proton channel family protein n=1 Tax=Bacillus sp. ISL-41 TaxID=2819127 RepID=UPI001BE76374|nr:MotA/TolQ/ExbB proton channel family protein [Bacillus sp. ISL-41]MBT2644633.1 MotA/TolQ/ExbB proton channel family protein [Bacillus sp. ISL-41]